MTIFTTFAWTTLPYVLVPWRLLALFSSLFSALLPSALFALFAVRHAAQVARDRPAATPEGVALGLRGNLRGRAPWVLAITVERLRRADVFSLGTD